MNSEEQQQASNAAQEEVRAIIMGLINRCMELAVENSALKNEQLKSLKEKADGQSPG